MHCSGCCFSLLHGELCDVNWETLKGKECSFQAKPEITRSLQSWGKHTSVLPSAFPGAEVDAVRLSSPAPQFQMSVCRKMQPGETLCCRKAELVSTGKEFPFLSVFLWCHSCVIKASCVSWLSYLKQLSEETVLTRAWTVLTGCNFMPSKKRREMWTGRGKAFTVRRLLPFFYGTGRWKWGLSDRRTNF